MRLVMGRHSALRQMRIVSGLTQQAVADQLGVTQNTISNYESRRRHTTPDRLAVLVSILSRNRAADPAAALEADRRRRTMSSSASWRRCTMRPAPLIWNFRAVRRHPGAWEGREALSR